MLSVLHSDSVLYRRSWECPAAPILGFWDRTLVESKAVSARMVRGV